MQMQFLQLMKNYPRSFASMISCISKLQPLQPFDFFLKYDAIRRETITAFKFLPICTWTPTGNSSGKIATSIWNLLLCQFSVLFRPCNNRHPRSLPVLWSCRILAWCTNGVVLRAKLEVVWAVEPRHRTQGEYGNFSGLYQVSNIFCLIIITIS